MPRQHFRRLQHGLLVLAALAVVLCASPAFAHKLHVFACVQGKVISGEVYFSGGNPARGAKITLFDPSGKKLGEATSDDEGNFTYRPRVRCDHRVVVDTGDGHAAEYTVSASELPDNLDPKGDPAPQSPEPDGKKLKEMIEEAVARQVVPLRKQLDHYEQKTRLRDVLGGIGYILGIMGLVYYFLGKRKAKSEKRKAEGGRRKDEG